ncbi:ABC transporter permease [Bdellovibrio bacteriovorus]|uniref:ABC transporter permease n=1 Tax=Bdellovibrio bacteriovorus TaxID=959 RepID=UPI0021CE7688|nr:ABC transporter permease [Bdellovibrio bacteriovorus]UXR63303.1 ABC transporter permease [Bdellovibrio bacteriovorus]
MMSFIKRTVVSLLSLVFVVALAGYWLQDDLQIYREDLIYYGLCHIKLVGWSMFWALVIGVPAGTVLSRPRFAGFAEKIIQIFNVGNAIPTMAVLALALVLFGIGDVPAILALVLASLLPIVRNTYEGLVRTSPALLEAAKGVGMTPNQSLFKVELPNAIPIIIGGVRTALAINVGTAPLSFIIGGDSLGGLIFPGIYLNNQGQLLLGALATALLALFLDSLVALFGHVMLRRRGLA